MIHTPDDIPATVKALGRLTVPELKQRYAEVFGEPTRTNHKQYLIKRIVWRMQALREGGLSERARRRAVELADEAEIRLTAPRAPAPGPGTVITSAFDAGRPAMTIQRGERDARACCEEISECGCLGAQMA
ncbi:MAG: DUF2924 domain-containing protein [Phycisphaeraceae bacterium]|nr:MAG: DUF2924 domain-containing protein [Phycisphaeraceae bacterium]